MSNTMTLKTICHVLVLALLTVVTGCSKKDDVDPRDQYLGTYTINGGRTIKNSSSGQSGTLSTPGTPLTVQKGTVSDELTFTAGGTTYPVKLTGSTFTIPSYNDPLIISGTTYTFTSSGSGSFSGKMISITDVSIGTGSSSYLSASGSFTGSRP